MPRNNSELFVRIIVKCRHGVVPSSKPCDDSGVNRYLGIGVSTHVRGGRFDEAIMNI
jgi:hypothetical protein